MMMNLLRNPFIRLIPLKLETKLPSSERYRKLLKQGMMADSRSTSQGECDREPLL